MSAIFDNLGYVRRLERAGIDRATAEVHADPVRDFILAGAATKKLRAELVRLEQRMTIKLSGFLMIAVGAIVALERLLA